MDYYKLDSKDIIIIQSLSKNSRAKLSNLADQLGLSIPTIRSRIDKLVDLGIIQDFTITLSYELLSEHPSYYITIKSEPAHLDSMLNYLYEKPEFLEVHELVSSWHVLLRTIPLSMQDLHDVLADLRQINGMLEIETMSVATTYKHKTVQLPSQDIQVRLRCELCQKLIEKDYQTFTKDDVTHFLCCKSCLIGYEKKNEITA